MQIFKFSVDKDHMRPAVDNRYAARIYTRYTVNPV